MVGGSHGAPQVLLCSWGLAGGHGSCDFLPGIHGRAPLLIRTGRAAFLLGLSSALNVSSCGSLLSSFSVSPCNGHFSWASGYLGLRGGEGSRVTAAVPIKHCFGRWHKGYCAFQPPLGTCRGRGGCGSEEDSVAMMATERKGSRKKRPREKGGRREVPAGVSPPSSLWHKINFGKMSRRNALLNLGGLGV